MISPSKILLFAFCVAAFISYYSKQFIEMTHKLETSQQQIQPQPTNDLVYEKIKMADAGREIRVPMNRDGHYWVTLYVNSTPVRFVIDTGASQISLSYEDAEAIGLDPMSLDYNRIFKTANGDTYKALVRLDQMSLEAIQVSNITASVSQRGQLDVSLLGMNFLNKLSGFKVEGRELILKP